MYSPSGGPKFKGEVRDVRDAGEKLSMRPLTIRTLIDELQKVAAESHLGSDTVVVLCEAAREYVEFAEVVLEQDDQGALVLLKLRWDFGLSKPKR